MTSPLSTKSGTLTVAPVSSLAGLVVFVAVSPRKPGSVSTIFSSTCAGRSTPIGVAVVELHVDDHAVFQEIRGIADKVALERDVFERLLVHEVIAVGVVVEHLHLAVVHDRALEFLARAKRALQRGAGLDVLQPRAHEGRSLSRLDVQKLDDGPELTVHDDGHAVAKIVRRNHGVLRVRVRLEREPLAESGLSVPARKRAILSRCVKKMSNAAKIP